MALPPAASANPTLPVRRFPAAEGPVRRVVQRPAVVAHKDEHGRGPEAALFRRVASVTLATP
jgi:hypothetical protein